MKKKILLFYPSFENGGATKNLINIVNYLLKKKIKVILFSHNAKKRKFKFVNNLQIINNRFLKNIFFLPNRWTLTISTMVNLYKYCKSDNEKSVVFSMQSHVGAILVSKIFGKKIIIRNSEELFGATKYADNKFLAYIVLVLKILLYNFCDKIIAISNKSRSSLQKIVFNKKKILLIYNPYLTKIFNSKRKNKFSSFNILSVGRFTKQKNFEILLKSFDEISTENLNCKLTLIGSGPLEKKIKVKYQHNKKVKILPWKSNLKQYYVNSNLFVLTSFYEGLPNVLIDAVNYKTPVISTNVSGAEDILLKQKGGNIVPIGNKKKLKNQIIDSILNYNKFKKKALIAHKHVHRFSNVNLIHYYNLMCK